MLRSWGTWLALLLLGGCKTANIGPGFDGVSPELRLSAPSASDGLYHLGDSVTFTVLSSGYEPFTVDLNLGGGALRKSAVSLPYVREIWADEAELSTVGSFTAQATVTDRYKRTGTAVLSYTVEPPQNRPPVFESIESSYLLSSNSLQVDVTVSDPDDNETLVITLTPPPGLRVDQPSKTASATGPLSASFFLSSEELFVPVSGRLSIEVSDGKTITTYDAEPGVQVSLSPRLVPADTLVCVPLRNQVSVGEEVQVVVLSGVPANPFQYMVGCGLTIESDADYVPNSFDVGSPDSTPDVGVADPVDGIWATMNPDRGFLLAPDAFISSSDIDGGRKRWDFNITPLGGSSLATSSGALFNVKFTFSAAGSKTFGFQDVLGVKRTYYSDGVSDYYWGDISNDGSVVPNAVTVQ